jgi:hypothetical protein
MTSAAPVLSPVMADNPYLLHRASQSPKREDKKQARREARRLQKEQEAAQRAEARQELLSDMAFRLRLGDRDRECPDSFSEDAQLIADLCCAGYSLVDVGLWDYGYKQPGGKEKASVYGGTNQAGRRPMDESLIRDNELFLKDLATLPDIAVRNSRDEERKFLQIFARTYYSIDGPEKVAVSEETAALVYVVAQLARTPLVGSVNRN